MELDLNLDTKALNLDVANAVATVHNEFVAKKMQLTGDPDEVVAFIAFELGRDYYKGAKLALDDGELLTGTSAVRSGLENAADLFFIYIDKAKSGKRAKAYVDSIQTYRDEMIKAKLDLDAGNKVGSYSLKQVNTWTSSTIATRISAAGPAIATTYDMLSHFSHPNPAAITFLGNPRLLKGQLIIVHQANCVGALTLCSMAIRHCNLNSVTSADLDAISDKFKLGLKFQTAA